MFLELVESSHWRVMETIANIAVEMVLMRKKLEAGDKGEREGLNRLCCYRSRFLINKNNEERP